MTDKNLRTLREASLQEKRAAQHAAKHTTGPELPRRQQPKADDSSNQRAPTGVIINLEEAFGENLSEEEVQQQNEDAQGAPPAPNFKELPPPNYPPEDERPCYRLYPTTRICQPRALDRFSRPISVWK
jgi:hypothetical protein